MALRIYTGGTTGAQDGTLEVGGDGQGLTLGVGATGVQHLRCDEGEQTAESVVVNAPTGCEVSADGVTFGATATYPAESIQDANVACHVKRTATGLTADEVRSGTTTPRLALVAVEPIPAATDTTAPTLTGTLSCSTESTSITMEWPDATDDVGVAGYEVEIRVASGGTFAQAIPNTTASNGIITGLTPSTAYIVRVRAYDAAGNKSSWLTSPTVSTKAPAGDTTAPAISGTLTATPTATQGQVALAGPTATDAVGIAKWQYQVDAGAWVDVSSTSTTFPTTNVSGLSVGSHTFAVRAVDAAANASTTKTASATVADITAPAISGTLTATVNSATQVTLAGPTATDALGIAKWQYRIGTGSWVDVASTSGTFPSTAVTGLTPGTAYTFEVRALDAAGNASTTLSANATTQADVITTALTLTFDDIELPGEIAPFTVGASAVCDVNGSGQLEIKTTTITDNAYAFLSQPIDLSAGMTYKERITTPTVETLSRLFVVTNTSAIPTEGDINAVAVISTLLAKNSPADSAFGLMPLYYNTAGTLMRWHSSGTYAGTWNSTVGNSVTYTPTTLDTAYLWLMLETTETQWRMVLSPSEDGSSPVIQTAWVNISDLMDRDGTGHYLCLGAQTLAGSYGTTLVDTFKVV